MILYFSGPMSGYRDHNFPAFHAAAKRLREMGYDVINPAEIEQENLLDWSACLRNDLRELLRANAVVTLSGWQHSRGARLEVHVARALGMPVNDLASLISTEVRV